MSFLVKIGNDWIKVESLPQDSNTIYGGSGDDYILSGVSSDYVNGGDGNDLVEDSDFQGAEPNNDTMIGGAGNDYIFGVAGNDYIDGGSGDDSLQAGTGLNTVIGGLGNDTIYAWYSYDNEVDILKGGQGNDSFLFTPGEVFDLATGGAGKDTFVLYEDSGAINFAVTDFTRGQDKIDLSDYTYTTISYEVHGHTTDVLIHGNSFGGHDYVRADIKLLNFTGHLTADDFIA